MKRVICAATILSLEEACLPLCTCLSFPALWGDAKASLTIAPRSCVLP